MLDYFDAGGNERLLKELVLKTLEADDASRVPHDALTESILVNIKTTIRERSEAPSVPTIPVYQRNWFRAAAVAGILLLAAITGFVLTSRRPVAAPAAAVPPIKKEEIMPGKDAARLTLADGSVIVLDSAGNGALASQGAAEVTKQNGAIAYGQKDAPAQVLYNTLSTARGNQYQLQLADGSRVWLNAASSIRFPTTFTGNDRRVEITGEAYFEVAHDAARPFFVQVLSPAGADLGLVRVLGTHFNVQAYADESAIKTTLLEGAVQFTRNGQERLLQPGQQAVAHYQQQGIEVANARIDKEMAWKNGQFLFDGDHIEDIMRQISRWYDIDVTYAGAVSQETFSGLVSRNSHLSQVLKILEVGGLNYKLNGKKMIVTQ